MDEDKLLELLSSERDELDHIVSGEVDDRNEAIAQWVGRTMRLALQLAEMAAEKTSTSLDDRAVQVAKILGLPEQVERLVYEKLSGD